MRFLIGLVLAAALATSASAVSFKIGYGNAVGTLSFPVTDA